MVKRVGITGSTGFLGSNLVNLLLQETDWELVLFGKSPTMTWKLARVTEEHLDFFDLSSIQKVRTEVDFVVHLAWSNLDDYDSEKHFTQLSGHKAFLQHLNRNQVERIFITGTCFEYEPHRILATEESANSQFSNYGRAKKELQEWLHESDLQLSYVWMRISYVYGEGQPPRTLCGHIDFLESKGIESIQLLTPDIKHDYIYVKDLVRRIYEVINETNPQQELDLRSGSLYSVREIAINWIKKNNYKIRIQ
jgi:nucleoside-diphosphate-sugar epimerase